MHVLQIWWMCCQNLVDCTWCACFGGCNSVTFPHTDASPAYIFQGWGQQMKTMTMKHFELRNLYGMFLYFKQIQNPEYLSELSTRIIKSQLVAIKMTKLRVLLQDNIFFVPIFEHFFGFLHVWVRMIKLSVLLQDNKITTVWLLGQSQATCALDGKLGIASLNLCEEHILPQYI